MGMTSKEFFEGQIVDVETPDEGDIHNCAFQGTITAIQEDTVTVRDREGAEFDVAKSKVSLVEN